MKLVINGRFLTRGQSGVQNFAAGILQQLQKAGVEFEIATAKNDASGGFSGWLWEQYFLPSYIKKQKDTLLINLCNSAPLRLKSQVVTVHDLAFEADPGNWFKASFRRWYRFMIPRICKHAKIVFTVSQFSKEQLVKRYSLPENKVVVLPNGLPEFSFDDSIKIDGKYVVLTGIENPRKNAAWIMENIDLIAGKGLKLVALKTASGTFGSVKMPVHPDLLYLENVSSARYFYLLKHAEALIYPSLYEGFGIPVLESLSLGTPVIASDLPVFRESFGGLPAYFKLNDRQSFAQALENTGTKEIPAAALLQLKNNYNFETSVSLLLKSIRDIGL